MTNVGIYSTTGGVFSKPKQYFKCFTLSTEPVIWGIYWKDLAETWLDLFAHISPDRRTYIMVMHETHITPRNLRSYLTLYHEMLCACPNLEITFLANTDYEHRLFLANDIRSLLCHKDSFIDEGWFKGNLKKSRPYKVVSRGSFIPENRYDLAIGVNNCVACGDEEGETDYISEVCSRARSMDVISVDQDQIKSKLFSSTIALSLADSEGEVIPELEYFLAGLPTVIAETEYTDGQFHNVQNSVVVRSFDEAVDRAVRALLSVEHDRELIRHNALVQMLKHRKHFVEYVQEKIDREGTGHNFASGWKKLFRHRFGLRNAEPSRDTIRHLIPK